MSSSTTLPISAARLPLDLPLTRSMAGPATAPSPDRDSPSSRLVSGEAQIA